MKKPLAILRFKWKDQPQAVPKWDNNTYTDIFISPAYPYGIARYWIDHSYGLIDFTNSQVFDWHIHDLNFLKPDGKENDRAVVIQKAVQQMEALGTNFDRFEGIIVMFPKNLVKVPDAGASGGVTLKSGKTVHGALLNEEVWQTIMAHEVGHVIGFDHAYGYITGAQFATIGSYRDQYSVMSAMNFNGLNPSFSKDKDMTLVAKTGDSYCVSMGPGPSLASMYHYLPEFKTSGHVHALDDSFRRSPVFIRLYASHTGYTKTPVLITTPVETITNPFEKIMLIEYRAGLFWDQGFQTAPTDDRWNPVTPALVVHSIRDHAEVTIGYADIQYVMLEGFLPIPIQNDSDLSFSGARDLGIQVISVAPDHSYLDLIIGNADWADQKRISALIPESQTVISTRLVEEGIAQNIKIPPNCGAGDFSYQLFSQVTEVVLSARAFGYRQPFISWKINGQDVPQHIDGMVAIFIDQDIISATGVLKTNKRTFFHLQQVGNKLIIKTNGDDGNFDLWVEVSVIETDQGSIHTPNDVRSQAGTLRIESQVLVFGQDYTDAVAACFRRYIKNLPFAPSKRRSPRSDGPLGTDLSRAALVGTRFERGGMIDQKDILAAQKLIDSYQHLPALAAQLQAGLNIIIAGKKMG